MPIYEYVCKECGEHLEIQQKISDGLLTYCPSCDAPALEKQISAPGGFKFKGSKFSVSDGINS